MLVSCPIFSEKLTIMHEFLSSFFFFFEIKREFQTCRERGIAEVECRITRVIRLS